MKIPRDISADKLIKSLEDFGYKITRQKGSHIRLSKTHNSERHNITIPKHNPIKIGTLNNILIEVSNFHNISKQELIRQLFG